MKKTLLAAILFGVTLSSSAQMAGSGNAYDFASNDILIPHNASLNSPTLTLEAWINADSWATNVWENVIISKDGWASGEQGYSLRSGASGTLSFNIGTLGAWIEVTSAPVMSTGQWYHVAGTYDGTTLKVYINGEEVGSTAYTGAISASTYDVTLGRITYTAGGARYFDGEIDEVKIWGSALPQSSIQDYLCQKVGASHPQYADLMGYWNFDDAGSVIDQSVNANNGTVTGATHGLSGAPIGDQSVYTYNSTVDLTLPWSGTDSLQVTNSTVIQTVHVYLVDAAPLNPIVAPGTTIDLTHYYGVFAANDQPYSLNTTYHYGSNPLVIGSLDYADVAGHLDGSTSFWSAESGVVDQVGSTITHAFSDRRELVLAVNCPSSTISPSGNQSICSGDSLTLSNSGGSLVLQWYDASGPISGETNNTFTTTMAGDYYLVANTGACLSTSSTVTLTVNQTPTVSFGTLDNAYCENDAVITIANGTPSGGVYSGNGVTGSDFLPSDAGVGTHILYYNYTDVSTSCSNLDSTTVTVNAQPATPVITTNGAEMCVSSGGIGVIYEWYLESVVVSSGSDTCYTATLNGNYDVICISPEGCISGLASETIDFIGIQENDLLNDLTVAPNPTSGMINVSVGGADGLATSAKITDALGRILLEESTSGSSFDINIDAFPSGVYWLSITKNGRNAVVKVVKN
ncbi:MAG: T9SS type A sorting domain-containing protein [Crocinitomicaceae bacterium]|nr:T9SS type A sorting domain-containing protein [Crocinitomicaceae bacterium]